MRAVIEVTDAGVQVQTQGPDGAVICKAVSARDLGRAFAEDLTLDSGWLGPGVRRFAEEGGTVRLLVEDPPMVRTLRYEHTILNGVPTPRCVFAFRMRNGSLETARLAVCAEVVPPDMQWIPRDATPLARFPFPNVFQDTKICWGRDAVPSVSITTVAGLVSHFWNMPFNHDLSHIGVPGRWRDEAPPQGGALMRKLADVYRREHTFPRDLLVGMGTLGEWWAGGSA